MSRLNLNRINLAYKRIQRLIHLETIDGFKAIHIDCQDYLELDELQVDERFELINILKQMYSRVEYETDFSLIVIEWN